MADKKLTAERVLWHREQCAFALARATSDHAREHYEELIAIQDYALQALAQPEEASITQQFERLVTEKGAHAALAGMSLEAQVALANVLLQKGAQPEARENPDGVDDRTFAARLADARYILTTHQVVGRTDRRRILVERGYSDAFIDRALQELQPEAREGYVLVPVELNAKMLRSSMKRAYGETVYENMDSEALGHQQQYMREIYAAMIRAAQDCAKPPSSNPSG